MNFEEDKKLSLLLIEGQRGDQVAYGHFLKEVSAVLRAFLLSRVKHLGDREDILQEALVAIHRARHTYAPGRPVGPWIYAICENRLIDNVRKRNRVERFEVSWIKDLENHFKAEASQEHYQLEKVFEIMGRLPKQQREILELLKVHGFSVAEVSIKTGMSESAVKVSAFRGYEIIRKGLGVKK